MHYKNIKRLVIKQLKKDYPYWKRLSKKQKKEISKKVLEEVVKTYDFKQDIEASQEELLGIENQVFTSNIMNLEEMAAFIEGFENSQLIKLSQYDRSPIYIKDEELKFIDNLLDDRIINHLLSYTGYRAGGREFFPSHFFRAELLKAIKYPEISYRKFCTKEYMGRDRKENRVFMGLPLNKKKIIDHTQLSQFRSQLGFSQLVNVLVYVLHYFQKSGLLGEKVVHSVDSTELANYCKKPLASIKIGKRNIRIYDDLDCDCGQRRDKRDKSVYVVGYRLHTLAAINAETMQSYPLISLLAPANHHDSNFLKPLIQLAKAIGIDLKLITADEAYHDKDGSFYRETETPLVTPISSKVKLPENVDPETKAVTLNDLCEIPMERIGSFDDGHEFKCGAASGECIHSDTCPQSRVVPYDSGYFQRIFHGNEGTEEAVDIRKHSERPFNLLKNQTGLETVRVRSRTALLSRTIFSSIGTLLLEMAGTRRKEKPSTRQKQKELPLAIGMI